MTIQLQFTAARVREIKAQADQFVGRTEGERMLSLLAADFAADWQALADECERLTRRKRTDDLVMTEAAQAMDELRQSHDRLAAELAALRAQTSGFTSVDIGEQKETM